jgi:hypothetical protein
MEKIDLQQLEQWYALSFDKSLSGRQILFQDILPIISKLPKFFKKQISGYSENNTPIYKITIGRGSKRILIWTQMHGNESTGTKAVFDLFCYFKSYYGKNNLILETILKNCSLVFIPLLNPDGAELFTRENSKGIDLNRDAVLQEAVESRLLRRELESFNPKFCFNLHDQRSIFNVSGTNNPATISFLAPSEEITRKLTEGRKETMSVIVAMNSFIQQIIPNQVGRYTDEFYPSATGDNFQKLGHNTILIEAGHFKDDLNRDIVRKFNFYALLQGLYFIAATNDYSNYKSYFDIPNNDTNFLDIIYSKIKLPSNYELEVADIGIQIKFKVENNKLISYKCIEKIGDLSNFATYNRINAENLNFFELELSNS